MDKTESEAISEALKSPSMANLTAERAGRQETEKAFDYFELASCEAQSQLANFTKWKQEQEALKKRDAYINAGQITHMQYFKEGFKDYEMEAQQNNNFPFVREIGFEIYKKTNKNQNY